MEEACAVLTQSVEIVGETPVREEARACVEAIHEFRTNRLAWEQMQALIDAASAAAQAALSARAPTDVPCEVTQSLIAIRLAQYELDLQMAFFVGTQQIEAEWQQRHLAAFAHWNEQYARGGFRFLAAA